MSKTLELARHLETLHINDMYKTDFYWTWDKTDDEIDAIFTVADALRDLRERNKSTRIFDSGLGISLFLSLIHISRAWGEPPGRLPDTYRSFLSKRFLCISTQEYYTLIPVYFQEKSQKTVHP